MAYPFTDPRGRFFDDNGKPLKKGLIEFYVAGSETPVNVYNDGAFTTSLGTSVALNGAGQFPEGGVFLGDGLYKVKVKSYIGRDDSGVEQYKLEYTMDDLTGNDVNSLSTTTFRMTSYVTDLRSFSAGKYTNVYCINHTKNDDEGGGWFIWEDTNVYADDNGIYIAPLGAPATGRYTRKMNSVEPSIRMWGANPMSSNTIGNLTNAIDYCTRVNKPLNWVAGSYLLTGSSLTVNEGIHNIADGCLLLTDENVDFTGAIFCSESLSQVATNLIVDETDKGYVRPEWWGVNRDGTSMDGEEFLKCMVNSKETILCSDRYLVGDTILDNGRDIKSNLRFVQNGELDTIGTNYIFINNIEYAKTDETPVVSTAALEYILLYGSTYNTSIFGITTSTMLSTLCLHQTELINIITDTTISFNSDLELGSSLVSFDFAGDGKWTLNGYNVSVISLLEQSIIRLVPHVDSLVSIRDMLVYKANLFGGNVAFYNNAAWTMLMKSAALYGKTVDFEGASISVSTGLDIDVISTVTLKNVSIIYTDVLYDGLKINTGAGKFVAKNVNMLYSTSDTHNLLKVSSQFNIADCEFLNGSVTLVTNVGYNFFNKNTITSGNLWLLGSSTSAFLKNMIIRDNFLFSNDSTIEGKIVLSSQYADTLIQNLAITNNQFEGEITAIGALDDRVRITKTGTWANPGNSETTTSDLIPNAHIFVIKDNYSSSQEINQFVPATQGSFKIYDSSTETGFTSNFGDAIWTDIALDSSIEWLYKVFTLNGASEEGYFTEFTLTNGLMGWKQGGTNNNYPFSWILQRTEPYSPTTTFSAHQTVGYMITNNIASGLRLAGVGLSVGSPTPTTTAVTANINFRLYDGLIQYYPEGD